MTPHFSSETDGAVHRIQHIFGVDQMSNISSPSHRHHTMILYGFDAPKNFLCYFIVKTSPHINTFSMYSDYLLQVSCYTNRFAIQVNLLFVL